MTRSSVVSRSRLSWSRWRWLSPAALLTGVAWQIANPRPGATRPAPRSV